MIPASRRDLVRRSSGPLASVLLARTYTRARLLGGLDCTLSRARQKHSTHALPVVEAARSWRPNSPADCPPAHVDSSLRPLTRVSPSLCEAKLGKVIGACKLLWKQRPAQVCQLLNRQEFPATRSCCRRCPAKTDGHRPLGSITFSVCLSLSGYALQESHSYSRRLPALG